MKLRELASPPDENDHPPREGATVLTFPANERPALIVHPHDLPATAWALRDHLNRSGRVFLRGTPVRLTHDAANALPKVARLNPPGIVCLAHDLTCPMTVKGDGSRKRVTLPDRVASQYLSLGDWGLPPLHGMTTAPILFSGGSIKAVRGYDPETGIWCAGVPAIEVPDAPTFEQAKTALHALREPFKTFPFADAARVKGSVVVDTTHSPGLDESTFLTGLLTAACRPSLPLAPGVVISAPSLTGAGLGKGLLVRAISVIAFGASPDAFTIGENINEFEKRLTAKLLDAEQAILIDNANGITLKSDLLASIMTEPRVSVRPLGTSQDVSLRPSAFVVITGNGISLAEDLTRRFLVVGLDAHMEHAEQRLFAPGFLKTIAQRRAELLTAVLTIWRWGRQNEKSLMSGKPLGSFEEWSLWVRDPLLTLGCVDAVERLASIKSRDPERQRIGAIFQEWWRHHGSDYLKASELNEAVQLLIDPKPSYQSIASFLQTLVDTRANGFVLRQRDLPGRWSTAKYALEMIESDNGD